MRIVHLSDPHFGALMPGSEEAAVKSVRELKPDLVLITGDITQRARRAQFQAARAFVEKLRPLQVLAVPGNHDIPLFNLFARVFFPYGGYRKHFRPGLEAHYERDGVEVLMLNSTKWTRHIDGELDLEHLRRQLGRFAFDSRFRLVAFHHPMDCRHLQDKKNLIVAHDEIARLLEEHHVDLVLGGHIHDPLVRISTPRYPFVLRPFVSVLAGTCLSHRIRADAPNSFHLIELNPLREGGARMEIFRYDRKRQERDFQRVGSHAFERAGSDWQDLNPATPTSNLEL